MWSIVLDRGMYTNVTIANGSFLLVFPHRSETTYLVNVIKRKGNTQNIQGLFNTDPGLTLISWDPESH